MMSVPAPALMLFRLPFLHMYSIIEPHDHISCFVPIHVSPGFLSFPFLFMD